jgi:hypothetical protein
MVSVIEGLQIIARCLRAIVRLKSDPRSPSILASAIADTPALSTI